MDVTDTSTETVNAALKAAGFFESATHTCKANEPKAPQGSEIGPLSVPLMKHL